jgi:hypothetical protein
MSAVKLWLDDMRVPPDDTWMRAWTRDQAIAILANNECEFASLDYDITWDEVLETEFDWEITRTGLAVVLWLIFTKRWPRDGVAVHSKNTKGAEMMRRLLGSHYRREL